MIAYLGNYTQRVAVSNHRTLAYENNQVTFAYKDYRDSGLCKNLILHASEFIRRFLQHILPEGFSKIRYFGFLALRHLKQNVDQCVVLLGKAVYLPSLAGLNSMEVIQRVTGKNPFLCPVCQHGRMITLPHDDPG